MEAKGKEIKEKKGELQKGIWKGKRRRVFGLESICWKTTVDRRNTVVKTRKLKE